MKKFEDFKFSESEFNALLAIAAEYEIPFHQFWNPLTCRKYAEPRQVLMVFFRFMFGKTLAQSAGYFDYDHAVVFRAKTNFSNLFKCDKVFRVRIESIFVEMNITFEEREKFLNNIFQPTKKTKANESKKRMPV